MSRALMVQGVSSDAGKSFLVTALCRWLRRRGVAVAPFKAQNMSNNARVVDGGEIGTAQWIQARAAGVEADVRMNPVLLKPESDTRSQVVLSGRVDHELTASPWRGRSTRLWPHVEAAYSSLRAAFDVVVIEGAGSPAETNLWAGDIVNMRVADLAGAPVLLVADIDRGGAFAHLYGTWALLPAPWQRRIEGFVLNKFRGDAALLDPAPADLEARTSVPVVGVVPYVAHAVPDEEGPTVLPARTGGPGAPLVGPERMRRPDEHDPVKQRAPAGSKRRGAAYPRKGLRVAILCGPYASNLDEFARLQATCGVDLLGSSADLDRYDLVILPGSKHVAADVDWLRRSGLARRVTDAAARGVPIMGICGGLQALGRRVSDPHGVEGTTTGLGLIDVQTRLQATKRTTRVVARFGPLASPWAWLGGQTVPGYEIRYGRTRGSAEVAARAVVAGDATGRDEDRDRDDRNEAGAPLAFVSGNVLGVYAHGLLEDDTVLEALTGRQPASLDDELDRLADLVDQYLDIRWLAARLGL
jgi:adenosylcobyric acid synthase